MAILIASAVLCAGAEAAPPIIDVTTFGARGDGATDDRAAIQVAIDSAPASGAVIHFPAGVYLLKSFHPAGLHANILRLRSNLTFSGTGPESEVRLHAGWYAGKEFNVFSNYDAADPARFGSYDNISFRDLLIDAGGSGNRYAGAAGPRVVIQFGDTSRAQVERVTFTGIDVTNVIAVGRAGRGASGFRVSGCTFIDPTSEDPRIPDHSTIYSSARDTVISGNTFRNATTRGKALATAAELHASRSTFAGNTVESYRQALYLASQEEAVVEDIVADNNVARDMNACFATFWGGTDANVVRRARIADNKADINPTRPEVDSTAQFIATTARGYFSEVTVAGNIAAAGPGIWKNKRAIATSTSIADWTVTGNRFSGWDGGGVHLLHGDRGKSATRVTITRNEFVECATAGPHRIPIYLHLDNAAGITVGDNKFRSSAAAHYLVYLAAETSADRYSIFGNEPLGFTPANQDVYIGGPASPGLPRGAAPKSVSGEWAIRRIRIAVPRLAAGSTAPLIVRVDPSEYATGRAIVSLLPNPAWDSYEPSGLGFLGDNMLTMIVRNRTGASLEPGTLAADLRVVYP